MANYLDYFGFKFPVIPQSARKPAQTTAPGAYTGSVGVERPTPPAPQTYRDYMPQQAPRWTPPVDEQGPLPTYRVQSTRQRTAAERMPVPYEPPQVSSMRQVNDMLPPPPTTFPGFNPETMTAMRQVNMLPPPSFDTTTEAPTIPGLRNAAAMPPLAAPAMYLARNLWENREGALGALENFPEASRVAEDQFGANVREGVAQLPGKIAAGIGKFTSTPVGSVIGAALGGTPEWKANAPTDPRTFGEEVQVAASRGLGGILWRGLTRPYEALIEPIWSGLRVRFLPQDYEQTVAEYKDARDELQRKIVEAQGQIQGRGGDRRALNELRGELSDLNRQMQIAYFKSAWQGAIEQGMPTDQGRAAALAWGNERFRNAWAEVIARPHEQKVAERERYREFAPATEQVLFSMMADPWNALEAIGVFTKASKLTKAEKQAMPALVGRGAARHVATLDEVGALTNTASDRARSWLGRHTPWQPTPESLAHAHVIESADTVTRISEVAQDAIKNNPDAIAKLGGLPGENPMVTFLREFIQDPDNPLISAMTGGFSQSLPAKRTVLLIRNIFGTVDEATAAARGAERAKAAAKLAEVEKRVASAANKVDELRQAGASASKIAKAETFADKARQAFDEAKALVDGLPAAPKVGDVDFDEMAKIIDAAKGDDIAAVADLASRYEEAARKIYGMPVKTKGVDGADVLSYKYPSQQSTLRKWRGNVSNAVSMMFLGTNPGYAFRNAANNLFTAMVDGVAPVQSADSLRTLWTRWGPAPWMTKQGVGAQGDVWKTREKAQEYIKSISEPIGFFDIFRAVETATLKDKFSVTLQVGQNFERYASERITAHHIRHYWEQVWPKTVRRITKELSGSFSMEQLHYIEHRLDGCMNPAEVRKVIEDITGAVPPTGSVAGSVPGGPVAPRPVPGGVPGGAPAGTAPTAGRTLDPRMGGAPQDVREGAMQAGGPDAVEAVDDVMRKARTPQEAVARITIREVEAENSTALSLAVESLRADALDAMDSKTATVEDLKDYLNRSVEIVRQAQEADTALIKATLKAQEGLDGAARDVLWQETRAARRRSRMAVMGELDQLDNELMPELGFDAKSIRSQSEYRAYVVDTWDRSDRLINNFWRDKRNGLKGATADEIYEAMQKERARLWDDLHQRRNAQIDAFDEEIKRAVGRLNTGDVPPKGAPQPPTEPTGPVAPAAPAAATTDLLPELGGPDIPAGAPTSSTVRYAEPDVPIREITPIPGETVMTSQRKAQVVAENWRKRVGKYADTPDGKEELGGTYTEFNNARANARLKKFDRYAKAEGLSADEIAEIEAQWKRLPLEERDPERYARRQAAKEARLSAQLPPAEADLLPYAAPSVVGDYDLYSLPPSAFEEMGVSAEMWPDVAETPRVAPTSPSVPPKPYESPEIVWEGEPGRMPPSYAPYPPRRVEPSVPELSPAERQAQHEALLARRDREAAEASRIGKTRTLMERGQEAVPGVRLQDAEEAGRMVQMRDAGELRQDEWDAYVKDLWNSNKINRDQRDAFLAKYPQFAPAQTPERLPGTRDVAQRIVNAEESFITWAMETGDLTRDEAERALATYKKAKAVKINPVMGQFELRHGAYAEADPLRRAAGLEPKRQLQGATGNRVTAYGTDPNRQYEFRYKVVSLDELIPSQTDAFTPNPAYPQELQPRIRDRAASRMQVDEIARKLQPDGLLGNFNSLDRGPMIVGPDAAVESGNGRVMALRKARADAPDRWQAYQTRLRELAPEYGIDAQQLEGITDPVLVRERVTEVDRVQFAAEANEQATLAMSPVEQSLQDAGRVPDRLLATLEVGDNQSVDQALTSGANRSIVKAYIEAIPANERAALVTSDGSLNAQGLARLKAALFAKTYPGDAGQRLGQVFLESLDPGIKNIEAGMFGSLPKMSRAESMVRSGERAADLALGDDLSAAIDALARLKEQGIKVDDYLSQMSLFADELTPFQKELLAHFDTISRSPKKVRELLNGYADTVEAAPNPGQMNLLGDIVGVNKEDIFGRIREEQTGSSAEQLGFFGEERIGQANTPAFGTKGQGLAQFPTQGTTKTTGRLDFTAPPAREGIGIVAPGTQQAQEVLDRIFKRNGMSVGAARIHAATSMRPVWSKLKDYMTATVDDLPPFTPEQIALLRKLANERIIPNMVRDKATVANLATQMRNFALGDYQNKRMIHEWLAYIFPWSYWYTFTYPNWAKRLLTNPSFVSNYARIKAQLAKTNREYYRAVMGDPNAEMPEYWEDQIRVPFHNTQLYFDLERTLIPLQALLNDFDSRTRNEAPGGRVLSDIQEWGPSLHPALTWAYAAWLSSKGYQDASDEWVGYVFPWSRPLKGATALAREYVPGLQKIIPPGGFSVEGALGLKNVEGGDIWERRRIGYALYTLLQEGKITQQQFEDAAYNHSGEAWDMARQREAVKRAPGNLGSYLFGAGFKARDMSDIEIDRMNREWNAIWDARYDQGVDEAVWRKMLNDFNQKYPFKKAVEMARESDQTERLKDYAYAVMDRLPPGQEYYRMLTEAGLTEEMIDRFKADKGDLSGWKEYEVKAFQAGIEKLAATVGVPTPDQKAEYDQYWKERDTIRAAVEQATGHTYAEYQAANDEYYAEGADKPAVLAKYPWLKAGWDASKSTKATSPTYQKFNPPTSSPTTGKAATATQSELSKKYDEAEKRFGTKVAQWADEYSSLPKTGTARADWKKANPEKYKQVQAYYDYIYGDTRTSTSKTTSKASSSYTSRTPTYSTNYSGGGRYSSGGSRYTSGGGTPVTTPGTTPVDTAPPTPAEPPAYEKWTLQDYGELVQEERNDDPAFDTFAGLMFGSDILSLASKYYTMTPEERAAWIAANPQLWAKLLKYLLWLMKQTGVKSDYTRMMQSIPPNAPNVPPPAPSTAPAVGGWSSVSTPHAPMNVPVAPPVPV